MSSSIHNELPIYNHETMDVIFDKGKEALQTWGELKNK